ncbi:hypothetical protein AB1Y20_004568 [Prymnesium parvum]|uniref:Uncharacterized protein n=1 Tax=Prymnesium parvum TaxID=97485 RepID=A0AB34IWK6_PRYPA
MVADYGDDLRLRQYSSLDTFHQDQDAEASVATRTRARGAEAEELAHADALELKKAYDELNTLVYDIIMASINISTAKLDYIERKFGEKYDGNALYDYVCRKLCDLACQRKHHERSNAIE